jgi:phosphate transport system substrate-binding protein
MKRQKSIISSLALIAVLTASELHAAVPSHLSGAVRVDGSSTVYPITEAVAEEFGAQAREVKVTVGISGTGGGMKKFCAGETDISNASRPIKATEVELCKKNGIEFIELPVAYDALTVVVNTKNTWANDITVKELKTLWEPEAQGKITTWNQVRSTWPNKPIKLYGAGVDSGTYDYFTEAIVGKEDASRGDYTSSEDDNVVVKGVEGDANSLGFFGLAYYEENKTKLKALAIDDENASNGAGAQMPNLDNVIKGAYAPLSRPLFVYVSKKSAERPEVLEFVNFYMGHGQKLVREVGYVPLTDQAASLARARFEARTFGTMFAQGHHIGVSLETLLSGGKSL